MGYICTVGQPVKLRQRLSIQIKCFLTMATGFHQALPLGAPPEIDATVANIVIPNRQVRLIATVWECTLEELLVPELPRIVVRPAVRENDGAAECESQCHEALQPHMCMSNSNHVREGLRAR